MPTYMIQATLTAEAWKNLAERPEDRGQVLAAHMEKMGCRLLSFYFAFGESDTITMFEAPDDATAGAIAVSVTAAGHLKSIKTTKLLTVNEAMEAMRKAGQAPYQGPGQTPRGGGPGGLSR